MFNKSLTLLMLTLKKNPVLHFILLTLYIALDFASRYTVKIYNLNFFDIVKWMLFFSVYIFIVKLILKSPNINHYAKELENTLILESVTKYFKLSFFITLGLILFYIFVHLLAQYFSFGFIFILMPFFYFVSPIFVGRIANTKNAKETWYESSHFFRYENLRIAFSKNYIVLFFFSIFATFVSTYITMKLSSVYDTHLVHILEIVLTYVIDIYLFTVVSALSILFLSKIERENSPNKEVNAKLRTWLFLGQLSLSIPIFVYIFMIGPASGWNFSGEGAGAIMMVYGFTIFIPNVIFAFFAFGNITTQLLNPKNQYTIFDFFGIGIYGVMLLFVLSIQFAPNRLNYILKSTFSTTSKYAHMSPQESINQVLSEIDTRYHDSNISHYSRVYAYAYNDFIEAKEKDILKKDIVCDMAIDCLHYFFNKDKEEKFLHKAWNIRNKIDNALQNNMQRTVKAKKHAQHMGHHFYDYDLNEVNDRITKITNFWEANEESICPTLATGDELYQAYQDFPFNSKLIVSDIAINDKNSSYVAQASTRGLELWKQKEGKYQYHKTILTVSDNEYGIYSLAKRNNIFAIHVSDLTKIYKLDSQHQMQEIYRYKNKTHGVKKLTFINDNIVALTMGYGGVGIDRY